jgi:hypothetical protein
MIDDWVKMEERSLCDIAQLVNQLRDSFTGLVGVNQFAVPLAFNQCLAAIGYSMCPREGKIFVRDVQPDLRKFCSNLLDFAKAISGVVKEIRELNLMPGRLRDEENISSLEALEEELTTPIINSLKKVIHSVAAYLLRRNEGMV